MASDNDIYDLIDKMTLEEKASLCSGSGFWHTQGIGHLDIPKMRLSDGPHGLRKQTDHADNIGLEESEQSTCFPTAATTACSFDVDLMYEIGQALGQECLEHHISILLGPGMNIKRSPLCGRNFEYYSEDPLLSGKMAAAYIRGVEDQGVGTSIKHFAVNNQEHRRMTIDSIIDERALREIYLKGFEIAIREGKPSSVMVAYNRVNGEFCSEHPYLLKEILRGGEWAYDGLVISDWGGACNDRVKGIEMGMDLEMPSSGGQNDRRIVKAIKKGHLEEAVLNKVVFRLLKLICNAKLCEGRECDYDQELHHDLARRAAAESIVLLKNDRELLPLKGGDERIGVIGSFAKIPRYQGSGSSLINPNRLVSILEALDEKGVAYTYEQGYDEHTDMSDDMLAAQAVVLARSVDIPILVVGLTNAYESEGFDRQHMLMPYSHVDLINAVCEVNSNTVVVLQNGSPMSMPWLIR